MSCHIRQAFTLIIRHAAIVPLFSISLQNFRNLLRQSRSLHSLV